MENKVLKRILVMAIVFVITFSNCGLTLQALATSDGLTIFGFSLFGKDKISYKAYFLDENGKEKDEMTADVNGEMTLVLEFEPKEVGYLKSGTVRAVTEEGEPNFEFKEILNLSAEKEKEEGETLQQTVQLEETLLQSEQVLNTDLPEVELNVPSVSNGENIVGENTVESENTTLENTVSSNVIQNNVANETVNNTSTEPVQDNTVAENNVVDNTIAQPGTNTTTNEVSEAPVEQQPENTTAPETSMPEDVLVDEEKVYQDEAKEKEENNVIPVSAISAKINSANEILIENIVDPTKIYVKLAYKAGETLNVSDLYKETSLEFNGTYINEDLEEVEVGSIDKITTEWTYSKDILVSTEISKVSPFEVEGTKGTLVESRITVNRDCTEENYLPLKETFIEFEAPQINGKSPIALDVRAEKLKATVGEEINEITFTSDNWTYNSDKNTITIKVENPNAILTSGEDIYVIVYRYDEYVESEEIALHVRGTVTAEEYSGRENNKIVKEFSDEKKTIVNIGELITYSIGTTEDLINKAKINANYNSVEAVYETEFTSTVNINILTNDVLREFTLKDTKEFYIDKTNLEFEAQDILYKTVKFKYAEIAEALNQGGTIEIKSNTGDVLYTLNSANVTSQENCELALMGDIHGVEISVRDIKVNGTITVDFVKSIGKCAYEKAIFNNFEKIESRIKAGVKYGTSDEVIELTPLKTEKYFEKSYTRAEISMNTTQLSTIADNENVELKIELNNNNEKSDLYINPEFEVVFPSYVQEVEVKSVNLLYEEGLVVKNISLFKDAQNIQRMKIQLEGVQREFSTSDITNGTNIIVNTKIVVDDYTPKKDDQLKMYYFNQGVTNYQSQTDWKISSGIPDGIIKTTNGFDVEVFSFQAPSGFITANGIENYDGLGSTIQTIKQGEITAKAEMGETPREVTMTLAALNNTGNDCTDVVMIGRVPNTEATDVITGNKIGTNRNTQMVSPIIQSDINPIGCDIYYSYNPTADISLSNGLNGWIKTPEDMSQVKSFLIVPTSKVEAGTLFKFSYNFQIPANLPYEVEMYGAFGAYYNNHTDLAVVYESTKADMIGLVTEAGPKIEASLSVDIGDGADVLSEKRMKYTVTVVNSGSIDVQNINVKAPIPEYTTYTVQDGRCYMGDHSYVLDGTKKEMEFNIPMLSAGETKSFDYYVRTNRKPYLDSYATGKDEKGYYIEEVVGYKEVEAPGEPIVTEEDVENGNAENKIPKKETTQEPIIEKKYITEVPDIYITNKATITTETLANTIETNEIKNKLQYANFNTNITLDYDRVISPGTPTNFTLNVQNISDRDLKNVEAIFNVGSVYEFSSGKINGKDGEITFNAEEGKIYFKIPEMKKGETTILKTEVIGKKIDKPREEYNCQFQLKSEDMTNYEYSTPVNQSITRGMIDAKDSTLNPVSQIKENETIVISTTITNVGLSNVTTGKFKCDVPNNMDVRSIKSSDGSSLSTGNGTGKIDADLPIIKANESITVDMTLKAKNMSGVDSQKVILNRKITADNQEDIDIGAFEFTVLNTEKTDEEKEQDRIDELNKKYEEEQKRQEEEDNVSSNNTDNNTNNNNNNNPNQTQEQNNNNNNQSNTPTPSTPNTPNSSENNNNNEPAEKPEAQTYSVKGMAWLDENKDGAREDNEKGLSSIKVYLLTVGYKMIKSTTTDNKGTYTFSGVENGKYIVAFSYDNKLYTTTVYKKADVGEDRNSDVIENNKNDMNAISNSITVDNANIENIDIGLQTRDTFDLQISKFLTKATVTTKKGTKEYKYDNVDLAKIDIHSKELKGAKVELEYTISLENQGSLSGYADQVVDYIGTDIEFDEEQNKDWYKGNDGYIYIKNINQTTLNPGQKKDYKIKLTKTMTTENTGTVSNKVEILKALSNSAQEEKADNNTSVQNTIITVSTGRTIRNVIIIIFIIGVLAGLGYNKKLPLDIHIDKVYKTKNKKISLKKFYK